MTAPQDTDEPSGTGLQAERTHLAWQRTGLAFLGAGALLVHAAGGLSHPLAVIPGLFGMAVSAAVFGRGLLRYRATSAAAVNGTGVRPHLGILAVAIAASILSVAALLVLTVQS